MEVSLVIGDLRGLTQCFSPTLEDSHMRCVLHKPFSNPSKVLPGFLIIIIVIVT